MHSKWGFVVAAPLVWLAAWLAACSGVRQGLTGNDPSSDDGGGGSGSSSGGVNEFNPGSSGTFVSGDGSAAPIGNSGPCKGGHYSGTFAGLYTSHLTGIGIPIPVAGNVELTLNQQGTSDQTCHPEGEIPVPCNNVFTLKDGTITGVADEIHLGDGAIGGFPYFCTMTGTLDCSTRKLDQGWIQCTYCVGPLADGGMACSLLDNVLGTTGVGGHFAGPLTGNYDVNRFAFVNGTWNGAEALAGNDGTMPGPDGGSIWASLSDAGTYLGPGDFGGSGSWNAVFDRP